MSTLYSIPPIKIMDILFVSKILVTLKYLMLYFKVTEKYMILSHQKESWKLWIKTVPQYFCWPHSSQQQETVQKHFSLLQSSEE